MSRTRRDPPRHRRDRRPPVARPRRAGRGRRARPASASSTTCSTCSRATAASTSTVAAAGDLQTGAHHTVEDVGICLGQALDRGARRPRGDHPLRHRDDPDGRGARVVRDRRLGPRLPGLRRGPAGRRDRQLRPRADGGVLPRRVARNAKLTLHLTVEAGTNVHHMIEALFKAFARALRAAVAIDPAETGVPSTKGTLTAERGRAGTGHRDRRLRDGQPPLGREGVRARRRAPAADARPRRDPRGGRRRRARRRRLPARDGQPARARARRR